MYKYKYNVKVHIYIVDISLMNMQAKDWVNNFLALGDRCEGFQRCSITPYIHIMVYHVPSMLKSFDNLKQFSGQG